MTSSRDLVKSHEIITKDVTAAKEDQPYWVDYDVSDPSNITKVGWRLVTDGDWLAIDSVNGVLNGTPNNTDVGQSYVNISVWDGLEFLDSHEFNISVENERPYLLTHHKLNATQGQLYRVDYVSDDDGQGNITWYIQVEGSPWLTIDPKTGVLQGIPANNDVGIRYVNIWVTDGNGGVGPSGFYLVVENANDPPIITSRPVVEAFVDLNYTYKPDSIDIDKGDSVHWDLAEHPSGMTIKNGVIVWRPTRGQEGLNKVVLEALDGSNASATQTFNITVRPHLFLTSLRPCDGENVSGTMTAHGTVLGPHNVSVVVNVDGTGWSVAKGNTTWESVIDTEQLQNGNHTLKIKAVWQEYSTEELKMVFRVENKPRAAKVPGFPSSLGILAVMAVLWISRRAPAARKGGR